MKIFFFIFVTIRAKCYSTVFAFFIFIQFILIWLFWFAEFAEKLIDTTASRLAEHFWFCKKQGKDGMKFCSVGIPNLGMESEQTYVRRVAKRQSTCLGRSMNDCCWNPTDIDNEDGVILKGKSNIRVCLLRCVTPYEKGQKSAWIESLIGGQILKRQCANCTLYCFFFG